MSAILTYRSINELPSLFAKAESDPEACNILAGLLNDAQSLSPAWPALTQAAWKTHAAALFQKMPEDAPLSQPRQNLLLAMLNMGLDDDPEREISLRPHYLRLFDALRPNCVNREGLLNVIGLDRNGKAPLLAAAAKFAVLRAIQPGTRLWFPATEAVDIIQALDEKHCRIVLASDPEAPLALADALTRCVVFPAGGEMEALLLKKPIAFPDLPSLYQAALASMVTCLEATEALVDHILIPGVYASRADLKALCTPAKKENIKEQSGLASRWDYSRSLMELRGRLEKSAGPLGGDWNQDNVKSILTREAGRPQMAEHWAVAVAILLKDKESTAPVIQKFCQELQDQVVLWHDQDLFVKVMDKLPSKHLHEMAALTKEVAGLEYLMGCTVQMPYHLWTYTEKILEGGEKKAFEERVLKGFREGKPSADHFAWLWKKGTPGEERTRFLSNSDLLFKTLQKDAKGNYLKSQRDLRKAILDSDEFLYTLMRVDYTVEKVKVEGAVKGAKYTTQVTRLDEGDLDAIKALVRCAKRMPLLDAREKTTLLVKIARLSEEAKEAVEEGASVQFKQDRLTSLRSYRLLQEDLDRLVNEEIPANTAAIEEARSRGDLSENSEYKYAKEQQRNLNQRRAQLERDLRTCRAIDFAEQEVKDRILPGCVVTLKAEDGEISQVTLLGLFDTDSQRNWYSYESPMGKILQGKRVEDEITLPSEKSAVIQEIAPLSQETLEFLRH